MKIIADCKGLALIKDLYKHCKGDKDAVKDDFFY